MLTRAAGNGQADPLLAPIAAIVADVTRGAPLAATKAFASPAFITDDFSPYSWSGPDAARRWIADYLSFASNVHLATCTSA